MKKLSTIAALAAMSAGVSAAPTVYGLINKEIRHIDQEKEANRSTYSGVTDVDGFESRIGAKGSHEVSSNLKASYVMELGINSERDGANGDRIRIRRAAGTLAGSFGSVTAGQEWIPNTLRMLKLDPFTATGAQLLGLESGDVRGSVSGNFGMKARYFQDMFSYATPVFHGAQFSMTFDKSAASSTVNPDLVRGDGNTVDGSTYTLTYDRTFGMSTINLHGTYAMLNVENSTPQTLDNDQSFWTIGTKYSYDKFAVSFAMTNEARGKKAGNKDIERKHMMAALSYDLGMATLAMNYGKTEFDKDEDAYSNSTTGGEQSQMSFGGILKHGDHVKTRLIYKTQESKAKTGNVFGTKKSAKTNSIIAGLTIGF